MLLFKILTQISHKHSDVRMTKRMSKRGLTLHLTHKSRSFQDVTVICVMATLPVVVCDKIDGNAEVSKTS